MCAVVTQVRGGRLTRSHRADLASVVVEWRDISGACAVRVDSVVLATAHCSTPG